MESMRLIDIQNPFNAPVYHKETVTNTMNESRKLAAGGEAHGTVITADFQEAGRGRGSGRSWEMQGKASLPFTILLRYRDLDEIPACLALKAGLAVLYAIEDFAPALTGKLKIKWPNDVMIEGKKCAGILCETDINAVVYIGIGINVFQREFPAHLKEKAVSIVQAAGINTKDGDRFCLLEKTLHYLYMELQTGSGNTWETRLLQRLYKKDERITFIEGAADSGKNITGILTGINDNGEIVILPDGGTTPRSFITGELLVNISHKDTKNTKRLRKINR